MYEGGRQSQSGRAESHDREVLRRRADSDYCGSAGLAKIDAFQKLVASDTVDETAVQSALKAIGASCRSCHQVYRATDDDDNFILKPGSLDK